MLKLATALLSTKVSVNWTTGASPGNAGSTLISGREVPLIATSTAGSSLSSLLILKVAVGFPAAAGVKVMLMVQ